MGSCLLVQNRSSLPRSEPLSRERSLPCSDIVRMRVACALVYCITLPSNVPPSRSQLTRFSRPFFDIMAVRSYVKLSTQPTSLSLVSVSPSTRTSDSLATANSLPSTRPRAQLSARQRCPAHQRSLAGQQPQAAFTQPVAVVQQTGQRIIASAHADFVHPHANSRTNARSSGSQFSGGSPGSHRPHPRCGRWNGRLEENFEGGR